MTLDLRLTCDTARTLQEAPCVTHGASQTRECPRGTSRVLMTSSRISLIKSTLPDNNDSCDISKEGKSLSNMVKVKKKDVAQELQLWARIFN